MRPRLCGTIGKHPRTLFGTWETYHEASASNSSLLTRVSAPCSSIGIMNYLPAQLEYTAYLKGGRTPAMTEAARAADVASHRSVRCTIEACFTP